MLASAKRAMSTGAGPSGRVLALSFPVTCPSHCRATRLPSSRNLAASAAAAASPRASSLFKSQRLRRGRTPPRCSTQASTACPAALRTEFVLSASPTTRRAKAAGPSSVMDAGCSDSLMKSCARTQASTSSMRSSNVPAVLEETCRPLTAEARTAVHWSVVLAMRAISAVGDLRPASPRTAFSRIEGTLSRANSSSFSSAALCSGTCATRAEIKVHPCARVALSFEPLFLPPDSSKM
mmetsp:Transcript_29163/g.52857  ORF Transcript_29163/g.52857 Transcript_29163/m.52857 type:complete len:237 (-) Transcript_29163:373-1083(-)